MTVIVAVIAGFLASRMLWLAIRKSWNRPAFLRENYQGVATPTAAGMALIMTALVVEAGRAIFGSAGVGERPALSVMRAATLITVVGFGLLGLIDDLAGTAGVRGLAGHVRALRNGELTGTAMKMLGGVGISLIAAASIDHGSITGLLVVAAIVVLCANLGHLFDLRPGRTIKVGVAVFAVTALAAGLDARLAPVAVIVGGAAALVLDDLHERLMLGDTGAGVVGAVVGLGIAGVTGSRGRWVALAAIVFLNLVSEVVSFSTIIEKIPPLRMLDNVGRPRQTVTIDVRENDVRESTDGGFQEGMPGGRGRQVPQTSAFRATVGSARNQPVSRQFGTSAPSQDRQNQDQQNQNEQGHGPADHDRPGDLDLEDW